MDNLPDSIKWRGSTYVLEKSEGGKVYWRNSTSGHCQSCSVEAWKRNDPYDGKYS